MVENKTQPSGEKANIFQRKTPGIFLVTDYCFGFYLNYKIMEDVQENRSQHGWTRRRYSIVFLIYSFASPRWYLRGHPTSNC